MNPVVQIDEHLASIEDRLPGPTSEREALIAELRDHMLEVQEAAEVDGREHAEAVRSAVASLGSGPLLVAELRRELARHRTARAAIGLLAGTPAIAAVWLAILLTGPHAPWTERSEPAGLAWADLLGSTMMKIALVTAVLANLFFWMPVRTRVREPLARKLHRGAVSACTLAASALAVSLVSIIGYVGLRAYLAPASMEWVDIGFGLTLSFGALFYLSFTVRALTLRAPDLLPARATSAGPSS